MKINNFKLPKNILSLFAMLFMLLAVPCEKAFSQQTIINAPSSEVLPAGDMLLKGSSRFDTFSTGGNSSLVPSVTLGTGFGTELSTGVGTSIDGNKYTTVRGDFSAKKVWMLGNSTRLTTGATISPYFNQATMPNTFIYSHLSQRIKKTRTSITAGGYLSGDKSCLNTGGIIIGLEQVVISNKLRLAFDWLSSQDSYGRIGAGVKYRPIPTLQITGAVIIPNKDTDDIAFNVSISKFISLDNENPIKRRLTNVD